MSTEKLKQYKREYYKHYYLKNKEKIILRSKEYYEDNSDTLLERKKDLRKF